MKNSEFISLLTANTNKTKYLRTYSKHWPSGARRLPDEKLYLIGRLVSLIHARLLQGEIHADCKNGRDMLLLYNFQPFQEHDGAYYCTLDMLAKPIAQLDETDKLEGTPLQLVVNLTSSEVINNSMGLLQVGFITQKDIEEDDTMEPPYSYGFFNDFLPTTGYLPYESEDQLDCERVFAGEMDRTLLMQNDVVDAMPQAQKVLEESPSKLTYKYVAELCAPKEKQREIRQKGVSLFIAKIIIPDESVVVVNERPVVIAEAKIEDEVKHLEDSLAETATSKDERWG